MQMNFAKGIDMFNAITLFGNDIKYTIKHILV